MQKVILIGRLGHDPSQRYLPDGTPVTSFNLAVDDGYGDKKKTIWFKVSAWNKLAETCKQYLAKGRQVYVEGRLTGDDKGNPKTFARKDGTPGASFEVTARTVQFLGSSGESQSELRDEDVPPEASDEVIPF